MAIASSLRVTSVAMLSAMFVIVAPAQAGGDAVALGEVSTSIQRQDLDLRALLRSSAEEEIRALDLSKVPSAKRSILSLSLVRMDTAHAETTCVVSATLRDRRQGAIFAILEGRAHADSGAGDRAILRTAVRGAVARVPEALRK